MNVTLKLNSIIKALENIDSASLHGLCDDLIYAGALLLELRRNAPDSAGWNPAKHHTISSPADNAIELEGGLCVLEYSREENWVGKLKRDVKSIQQWADKESHVLVRFVFITTRDIGSEELDDGEGNKLSPKEYIRKKLCRFNVHANVFGQKSLLVALQNSDYFYIRRRWLNIPDDYFQSLESFESAHIKRSRRHHIYLKKFVQDSSRQKNINALERFVEKADTTLLLIHSHGGIGKTRFVLETLKRLNERTKNFDILLNQGKQRVDVDEVISEISEDRQSLIVLDDAHLIDNLRDFEKILIKRDCAKLILITRSTSQESVKRQINCLMEELELTPLDRESSIKLLKDNLENPLRDQQLRHTARICEGNPLLIGITTHLINTRIAQSFGDLKTDDLVQNYCDGVLAELRESNQVDRDLYEKYLALLFLLRPFDISNAETRPLIKSLMKIEETQEVQLLRGLKQCGILERHGNTLWLYPDLLGEYLVTSVFFADIPFLSFDDIFSNFPSSDRARVFQTLRELDNVHANRFLKGWARDLSRDIETQDNDELSDDLQLLEIIASIVPDETLEIIDYLLKPESEKSPKAREYMWSPKPREYCEVLSQCLRILENPDFKWQNFDESLEMLLTMHFYKTEVEEYSVLRNEAFDVIVATAAYNLNLWQQGCGYAIQTKTFGKIQKWKQEDLEKYLPLILGMCRRLLETEMRSGYADSEGIGWSVSPVVVTEDLINLRKGVIALLQSMFGKVQDGQQQIRIVQVLNCATNYPSWGRYEENMEEMIRDNAEALINFYLGLLTANTTPEVEIFQEIEERIHHLRTWRQDNIKSLDKLISALQSNEHYQLYRTLVGDAVLFWMDEEKSYEEVETETAEKIKKIADVIVHKNLMEWLDKLNGFAKTLLDTLDRDDSRFLQLLFEIGRDKPTVAQGLISGSVIQNIALKRFAAEFIRGIRLSSDPGIARELVKEWLSSGDQMLLAQIPKTYWKVDERSLDVGDLEIFETLLNYKLIDKKQRQELDGSIISNIGWIYRIQPEKIIEIICKLLKRADQDSILHHMYQLRWSGEQIDLSQWDISVFENLLESFVEIPKLNDNAVYILAQYGRKAPLGLVQFFESRVEKQEQASGSLFGYNPIPHFLKEIADIYQNHPQIVDVFKQILGWFQKHSYYYDTAAANLISSISPQVDGPVKTTLEELIKSGEREKVIAALKVLEELPENQVSDELCKEAVRHSEGKKQILDEVSKLIVNRVLTYLGLSGAVTTFQKLKERIKPWLEDENHYVCTFAQRIIPKIESRIEFEKERAAEDEIKRKKGLI